MPNQENGADRSNLLLLAREIRPICNWSEWLEMWKKAETVEWMESLLHVGFTVSLDRCSHEEKGYDAVDRYIFYFSVADGWRYNYLSNSLPGDREKIYRFGQDKQGRTIKTDPSGLRQHLARKAFNMLSLNLFKMELFDRDSFAYNWQKEIVSERLFPVIQNFFRVEETFKNDFIIHNLSSHDLSHHEEQAVNFLLNLTKFIWSWEEPDIWDSSKSEMKRKEDIVKKIRNRLDVAKPWTIEILNCLNKLEMLWEWKFKINKPCLAKLKEIALHNKLSGFSNPVKESRLVATLDEACYLGSKAGWFLKEYELVTREHQRLNEILKAEQDKERADRKIKKLSVKK